METSYTLMRGDTRLDVLTKYKIDQPWFNCYFTAKSVFERIRSLFDADNQAFEAQPLDIDTCENAMGAIEALNLHLVRNDGKKIGPMLLHIRGARAWFRY